MKYRSMTRRTALKSAVGTALAAGGLTWGSAMPVAAATGGGRAFRDVRAFHGTWEGVCDGHRARLRIVVAQEPPGTLHTVYLTFTDLERGATYVGSRREVAPGARDIGTVTLSGAAALTWPSLLVHTCDTDVLSGIGSSGGRGYPMAFHRSATAPALVQNRPFRDFEDWCGRPLGRGRYLGSLDGRRAQLDVDVTLAGSERRMVFHLSDLDRGTDWYSQVLESEVRAWGPGRQRNPLAGVRMRPYWEGQEPLRIGCLYWHGGNAAYVTGEGVGRDGRFGMTFVRRTPLNTR
ncbi:hypothetical protein LE181_20420 [Streptomyces sp. SCA3-4]|uniref:hypothetical protein n=1 Tax=Streptomyces sichuanensis TaxID=2871810 RepID=UPI001CE34A26|nr:hypothetical protein [Streptomyces sichuanensis]MCA6094524.1 hypothetical protein [Streptomyces sichuanensis]